MLWVANPIWFLGSVSIHLLKGSKMGAKKLAISICTAAALMGCMSKIKEVAREAKYSAFEAVGYEKRDIFKRQVATVKEEQQVSQEEFSDALTQLKNVYKVDGGKLEGAYSKLKDSYDSAEKSSKEVTESIVKLNTIAGDLFKEWEKEISEMSTADLKQKSRNQLQLTQKKFNDYSSHLARSEQKMHPVLRKFKDQVVYLKHNLNASALTGLKAEANRIEGDITKLLSEMSSSMKQADELISTL